MSSNVLFQAVLLGLLLANSMLLIGLASSARCRPVSVELSDPASPLPPSPPRGPKLNVVDVRREALERVRLREILGLGSTDRIVSVNDRYVRDPRAAISRALQDQDTDFLDLGVSRRGRRTRAIVLLHGAGAPPAQKTRESGG